MRFKEYNMTKSIEKEPRNLCLFSFFSPLVIIIMSFIYENFQKVCLLYVFTYKNLAHGINTTYKMSIQDIIHYIRYNDYIKMTL